MISAVDPTDDSPKPSPPASNPLVNPNISRSLGADYEALKNDLEQANEFAGELQNEVAANKNEVAHFRQLFAKTRDDLDRLQESIVALRTERHSLANEVMRARGAEHKLKVVSGERDCLAKTIEKMQQREEDALALVQKRDAQVAELTMQIMLLKDTFRQTQERLRTGDGATRGLKTASVERFGDS